MFTKVIKITLVTIGCVGIMSAGFIVDSPTDYPDKTEVRYAPVETEFPCTVIDTYKGTVCIVRPDGNAYYFNADGFTPEQEVTARFNNNGTPYDATDDFIVGEVRR